MTEQDTLALASINNAWIALCKQMRAQPDEVTQRAMNLLARVIDTAEAEIRRRQKEEKPKQISVDEWMTWLQSET